MPDDKKKRPVTQEEFSKAVRKVDDYIDRKSLSPAYAERHHFSIEASYWDDGDLVLCTERGSAVARLQYGGFVRFVDGLKDE